jgi:hypothetical protein
LVVDIGIDGGADGVDFSGSEVVMQGTRFLRVTDKAISVGESSELTARDVEVESCAVGAASKDASKVTLNNSRISDASVAGLMSYVKKPEYGPASLIADDVSITGTSTPARVQRGSELWLNGAPIETDEIGVESL